MSNGKTRICYEHPHFMISPILKNSLITLEFSPRTGALTALRSLGKDFIASASSPRPLFEMNFRDNEGNPARISGLDFPAPEFSVSGSALEIRFDAWKSLRVKARVRVHLDAEDCATVATRPAHGICLRNVW